MLGINHRVVPRPPPRPAATRCVWRRPAGAGPVGRRRLPESVMRSHQEVAELTAIKKAIATGDWAALEVYGGLNPARYSGRAFSALSEPVARSVG